MALSAALVLLSSAGCPSVSVVSATSPRPEDCVLIVHSKVSGLAHVPARCRVVAEFGEWRGEGGTPMVRNVPEPQDVFSEVRRWERSYSGIPEGQLRVRFMYQHEVLDEQYFAAPEFNEDSLERQLFWPEEQGGDWPSPSQRGNFPSQPR
ncbi:MAG: hypothetical protein R3F62_02120 [Planctomycetota bacterium]